MYDRFRLAAKLSFRSRVTFEKSSTVSYLLRSHSWQLIQSSHHRQLLELWPKRHSVITLLCLLTRSRPDPRLTLEEKILRSRQVSLRWCRPAHSVARPMRIPALISSSSWNYAVLLLSRVYRKMLSGSVCFRSLSWGERSNGFMLTRRLWTLGTNVNSQSLGETSGVHSGMSAPRNGQLAHSLELLQRVDACWYFVTSRIKSASAWILM